MDQKLDQQKVDRVSPGDSEPVARDFINAIGGRFGRFAQVGTQRFWTPLRVLITTSLVFLAMGFLTKANCIQGSRGTDGVVSLNWSGSRQYTSACYNDIVPLYGGAELMRQVSLMPFRGRKVISPGTWSTRCWAEFSSGFVALSRGFCTRLLMSFRFIRCLNLVFISSSPRLRWRSFGCWSSA